MPKGVSTPHFLARFRSTFVLLTLITLISCNSRGDYSRLADDPTDEAVAAGEGIPTVDVPAFEDAPLESHLATLAKYDYIDPQKIVPTRALATALVYFDKNKNRIKNKNYISIIDFSQSSRRKRFYIINMNSGSVWPIHVSHGKGSDPNHDGLADRFSNVSGSNASSLGFYLTAETYYGAHGLSLRLDGLSSTNSRARRRAIVIHGASYVKDRSVIQGRSWGCPAVSSANRTKVIQALKGGSLISAVY